MGFFNLFGDSEHRVFNYKPIYYNPEEDERRRKFGSVDGTLEKEKKDGTYVPSFIRIYVKKIILLYILHQ